MRRLLFLILASVLTRPPVLPAQGGQIVEIPTLQDSDYYAWITQLSLGKARWLEGAQDSVRGRRYRAAVLTSEIFSTLVIELLTYGMEGCCARVVWARRVDMEAFRRRFGLGAELAGLVVGAWPSDSSFEFTIQRRRFLAIVGAGPKLAFQER